ncbi:MAG: SIS domain-containing protein [bacterium]|nr:SIS domain-containing protein [bacterium]
MDNFFRNAILKFNEQLTPMALEYSHLNKLSGLKPDAIIVVGMGGSGQIGDLLAGLAAELKIPVPIITWKSYGLPKLTFKNPLYLFVSFSGDTEETLSGFSQAKDKAVICSGGALERLAEKTKTPLAIFCGDHLAPRQAGGYMFYGAIKILKAVFKKIPVSEFTGLKPSALENTGQKIARHLTKKLILLYTDNTNDFLAYNWKTRLNETAKRFAFANTIPEMGHNEIVPFGKGGRDSIAVFLADPNAHPRVQKKIRLLEKLFKKQRIQSLKIVLFGKTRLEKTWKSLILADWVSYHLAKLNKVNPLEIKLIDRLKELMR